MPIDWTKPAEVLVVHGVQTGSSADVDCDAKVRRIVERNLASSHLEREFGVSSYVYEDVNDDAVRFYELLAQAILSGQPLAGAALGTAIDLVGDVVIAAAGGSTAGRIREGLRAGIMAAYEAGRQLVVVAHSLGTVYALDVVNGLIGEDDVFVGDERDSWPVQGLVTMGSPLGLEIDLGPIEIFESRRIETLPDAEFEVFPWHNYFNALDPVVSGRVFGAPVEVRGSRGPVERRYGRETDAARWLLQGHRITSGRQWLLAHTAYWKNPRIGGKIVDLLWG